MKHLAPYLPYGLQMKLENFPLMENHIRTLELDCGHDFHFYFQNGWVKPLLIPLSELNNYMEEYNNIFYPNVQLGKMPKHAIDLRIQILSDYKTRSHEETDWLCYNHFDVFNLIDNGLAINKLAP